MESLKRSGGKGVVIASILRPASPEPNRPAKSACHCQQAAELHSPGNRLTRMRCAVQDRQAMLIKSDADCSSS